MSPYTVSFLIRKKSRNCQEVSTPSNSKQLEIKYANLSESDIVNPLKLQKKEQNISKFDLFFKNMYLS